MSVRLERLEWDSEFWERSVGRLYVDTADDLTSFVAMLGQARDAFDFVQLLMSADQIDHVIAAQDAGFRVVDIRCVVGIDDLARMAPEREATGPVEICPHDELKDVAELAARCHTVSRFASDPALDPNRTADLYRRWIHRDASRGWTVAVTRHSGSIDGYITFGREGRIGTVGIVGVAAESRRSGLGQALISYASRQCSLDGATSMRIVTQAGNSAAMAAYRKLQYDVIELGIWMHWHRSLHEDRG